MNYTRDEIKAGLMIVCSLIIFIFFVVTISGLELFQTTKEYSVLLKHTQGVVVGSLVRYGGLEVGKVTQLSISESNSSHIEIRLKIDEKIPIKKDSEAFLSSIGLLGDYYIEISSGSPNFSDLLPGGQINGRETPQFTQLTEPVEEISARLQILIDRISDLMNDQSREHVASMISTLDSLLKGNSQNVNEIMNNLNATTAHFEKMSQNLNQMFANEKLPIDTTWRSIDKTILQLQELTAQLQQTALNLNQVVISRDQNLAVILENVELMTKNLQTFTQNIKSRPWSLIRKAEQKPRALPK